MARRGSGLAARFQAAVQREEETRTDEERDTQSALALAVQELGSLLEDLAAIGADLPDATVERAEGVVKIRRLGKELSFTARPDGSAVVDFTDRKKGDEQCLFRQAELGDRWVWKRVRRGKESRLPLFDQALEILLVHGLGLPEPGGSARVSEDAAPDTDKLSKRTRTL